MAVRQGFGKVVTDGLVFAYDTGDTKNSYLGAPMFNASREIHNWPTRARATVTEYTVGDIEPPFPGAKISKAVCTSTSSGILLRDGGYYYGGGFAGTGNPQNTDLLSDRTNSYTPVGDNKFTFVVYAKSGIDTDDNTTVSIDIGDKNIVNVTNLENYDDWVRLETDDSDGINSQYPYDFFDITFSNTSIGNTIYLSAPMIIRTLGTDSGSLGTPPANIQYLPPKASRSYTGSLFDLTGNSNVDVTNVSFDSNADIDLDGTDDYIETADSSLLDLTTDMSFEFVVNADSSQGNLYPRLIDKSVYLVHITQTSPFTIAQNITTSGGLRQTALGSAFTAGEYTHIVTTYDGRYGQIFVNGELKYTKDFSTELACNTNSTSVKFGGNGGTGRPLAGKLPVSKVYNKVLSKKEVAQNFAHYKNRFNI